MPHDSQASTSHSHFFRRAFGTVYGLLSLFGTTIALTTSARAEPPQQPHALCQSLPSNTPQGVADFITTQCNFHSAIFADGTEPSVSYVLDSQPKTVGSYVGVSYDSHNMNLDIIQLHAIEFHDDASPGFPAILDGQTMYSFVAKVSGTEGKSAVLGMCFNETILNGQDRWLFIVSKIIDDTTMRVIEQSNRLLSGTRVTSLSSLESASLDKVVLTSQSVLVNDSDLSSLFVPNALLLENNTTSGPPSPTDQDAQQACIDAANEAYKIAMAAAVATYIAAETAAGRMFLIAMAGCTVGIFTGIGALLIAGCIAAAIAAVVVAMMAAHDTFNIAAKAARDTLEAALRACGVIIVEV